MTSKEHPTHNGVMVTMAGDNQEKQTHDIESSPEEISQQLNLNLSLEIYRELSRLALLRGCTPEQLLAHQLEEQANASGRSLFLDISA